MLASLNTFTRIRSGFLKSLIVLSVPFLAVAVTVYKRRAGNNTLRRGYLAALKARKFNLSREMVSVMKSRDFIAELLAFATVLIPGVIIITIKGGAPTLLDKVINSLEVFIQTMGFCFIRPHNLIWCEQMVCGRAK